MKLHEVEILEPEWQLAGMYGHYCFHTRCKPGSLTVSREAGLRKFLNKRYRHIIRMLPDEYRSVFERNAPEGALLSLLEGCFQQSVRQVEQRKAKFRSLTQPMAEEVQTALLEFTELFEPTAIRRRDDELRFLLEDEPGYRKWLCLLDARTELRDRDGCFVAVEVFDRLSDAEGYRMTLLVSGIENDGRPVELTFSRAALDYEFFDCAEAVKWGGDPWSRLCSLAYAIYDRGKLPAYACSDRERQLLPLCRMLASLDLRWREKDREVEYSLLKAHLKGKASALLAQMEKLPWDSSFEQKLLRLTGKLRRQLCRLEYEPLWRSFFDQLRESQEGLPAKADAILPREALDQKREQITRILREQGYSGSYPEFAKQGAIKGFRLAEAYDMAYWVGFEKRAQYRIRCLESCGADGGLTVELLAGAALLKEGEDCADGFGCLFDGNGRRFFSSVSCDTSKEGWERFVRIAAKKAELQKLTKEEKRLYYGAEASGWVIFLWSFVVFGGLFSILFTLGMMLIVAPLIMAFVGPEEVEILVPVIPQMLGFSWIGFGGAMGLIMALAKRK